MERKLTAILMGEDEEATLRTLSSRRKIIDDLIAKHSGRFVNSAGDSVLAEFASVVNAVQCATDIQTTLKADNANIPPERQMNFRIGVNLGDVIVEGEQIYGDGVNVAARLESLAEPGGICISDTVHAQIKNKLTLDYVDLGEQRAKNIAEPVRVLRVLLDGTTAAPRRVPRRYWRGGVLSLAGIAIIVGTIVLVQNLALKPPHTHASIPQQEKPALPLPSIPSIAVLPFTNLSGDPKRDYFSEGVTDDLITALSKVPNLLVIDRHSSSAYKAETASARGVSRELGVKYILEGSVRRSAQRLRIAARLVDATNEADIWAQRYDRPLKDIFSLQDEIVRDIATTLKLAVDLTEHDLPVSQPTDNVQAYDYLLQGNKFYYALTRDGIMKGRKFFQKAIEADPKYAEAYAMIAWTYFYEGYSGWSPKPQETLVRATEFAQRALALDETNVAATLALSCIKMFEGQSDQAINYARQATILDANFSYAYYTVGNALVFAGRPVEGVTFIQKAIRLDPRSEDHYLATLGTAYVEMGRYADAARVLKKNVSVEPDSPGGHMTLMVADVELGRDEEARNEVRELQRISPSFRLEEFKQLSPFVHQSETDKWEADGRKAGMR